MVKPEIDFNENGLSWYEWYMAATMGEKYAAEVAKHRSEMRLEWQAGVDPTEWARHFERKANGEKEE